jgi:thiol-disulfide isomerase/thioredoxin
MALRSATVLTCAALGAGLAACGTSEDPGAANPESRAADYRKALAAAPPPLAELHAQANALLDGGADAFERQLDELRGYPVVVNTWASWCGPCRFEFPFFQSQAAKHGTGVAFLGVDSDDSEDAAATFLEEFPVPYPSFSDPDREITKLVEAPYLPSTTFYRADGELEHTHVGGYASEDDLEADIERYARSEPGS